MGLTTHDSASIIEKGKVVCSDIVGVVLYGCVFNIQNHSNIAEAEKYEDFYILFHIE